MKTLRKNLSAIVAAVCLLASLPNFAQQKYTHIIEDTLMLCISPGGATVIWQRSNDSISWTYLPLLNDSTAQVVATNFGPGTKYFRALLSDGSCLRQSNVVKVVVKQNVGFLSVGDYFHGGVVFDAQSTISKVVALTDQASAIVWGDYPSTTNATSTSNGSGNTSLIVAGSVVRPNAASICDSLNLNGYSDWFLPAKDEIAILFTNRQYAAPFPATNYWSSTEANNINAWYHRFSVDFVDYSAKNISYGCRCVRQVILGGEDGKSFSYQVAVDSTLLQPQILAQPQDTEICENQMISLSVGAANAYIQWQKDSTDIPGETAAVLSIA
ncbi:MAG: DUF1566 domain-containing protein, partial [Bacteroidetes bacterium]|nr:DUF1566 domain-containing protein [Bacteroidota bacterium]